MREAINRLRVALVITAMRCGGAERQLAHLATFLAQRGHRVKMFVLHGGEVVYPLPPEVEVALCPNGGVTALARAWRRCRWLRRALAASAAEVAVSFIEVANVVTLLAAPRRLPVIVSERTDPRWHRSPAPYRVLRRLLYPAAARLVVQSDELRAWAVRYASAERLVVLPNPVFPASPAPPPDGAPRLVAAGRLAREKGFDLLLEAFAQIAARFPDWSLVIFGEGDQRGALAHHVQWLGLEGRVQLPGVVRDPAGHIRQGEIFVLPSRYEGFPNALAEAMASGVAVVAFDCPSGPRQLIRPGVDGVLAPPGDTAALAAALARLMADEEERRRLAARAPEVVARFSAQEILARWERLCREVVTAGVG